MDGGRSMEGAAGQPAVPFNDTYGDGSSMDRRSPVGVAVRQSGAPSMTSMANGHRWTEGHLWGSRPDHLAAAFNGHLREKGHLWNNKVIYDGHRRGRPAAMPILILESCSRLPPAACQPATRLTRRRLFPGLPQPRGGRTRPPGAPGTRHCHGCHWTSPQPGWSSPPATWARSAS
jgi:hypothetical protein